MNSDFSQYFSDAKTVSQALKIKDELLSGEQMLEIKEKIKTAIPEEKRTLGQKLNELRQKINLAGDEKIKQIQQEQEKDVFLDFDQTFFYKNRENTNGLTHPITQTINEIKNIFQNMGFDIFDGAWAVEQFDNFTSVNTPAFHPARDMQDTFFLNLKNDEGENYVLRTQATSNFAKYAKENTPPFRVIFPSITFRNETIDATHDINFHQFDMWMIDKKISLADLVNVMKVFLRKFFNDPSLKVRIRPSFFPFVEPGLEIDVYLPWFKGGRWVEVGGAGLVHRNVLKTNNINPDEWQGMACGLGVDRLTMIKYELNNIGQFYNGNLKFLKGKNNFKN